MRTRQRLQIALIALIVVGTGLLGPGVLAQQPPSTSATPPAGAATPPPNLIPSVGVKPATSNEEDPNAGQWFFIDIAPGRTGDLEANITNPANVPQTVRFAVA